MKRTMLLSIAIYVSSSLLYSAEAYQPGNNPNRTGKQTSAGNAKSQRPTRQPAGGISSPQLQGIWALVESELDGEKSGARVIRALGQSLTIKGNKFQETIFKGRSKDRGDFVDETRNGGTLKINSASSPKEIDFIYDSGPLAGETRKGIYRWEKGKLVICVSSDGADRPQKFKTQKGDKVGINFYRRR